MAFEQTTRTPPNNVSAHDKNVEPSDLIRAVRDIVVFLKEQPVVDLVEYSGVVRFPMRVRVGIPVVHSLHLNVRDLASGAAVAATAPVWFVTLSSPTLVQLQIDNIGGLTEGLQYELRLLVVGRRS